MILSGRCLNCKEELTGRFCANCGQPADTRRFTLRYILTKDFIWNVFHVNKGFLFSIKELFTRPGHSAREYVQGQRAEHLSYFILLIVMIGFFSLAESLSPYSIAKLQPGKVHDFLSNVDHVIRNYPKTFFITLIPVNALFSYFFFYKSHQNFAEHLVLNSFKMSATLLINAFFVLLATITGADTLHILEMILDCIVIVYSTWFYCQYFSAFYKHRLTLILLAFFCTVVPSLLISVGAAIILLK